MTDYIFLPPARKNGKSINGLSTKKSLCYSCTHFNKWVYDNIFESGALHYTAFPCEMFHHGLTMECKDYKKN